ncbi:PREDICTED: coiled-coil domain-containing protein 130 homolog [Priapulus caudatus]|uniref:Coiled-coil domain-containing protein 130 homolog n=1 Tax=Priapulus caudatus TaxID=37621 RepID=A0ABM1EY71_PRICU|nr:PREDICTED: coiled-coil domain-containing protein 130 homolog [Priapulus caudatus]
MGERKGQNHYYPPDFDYKKHHSLNEYHGTHALRERARKIKQGILIIRFEMPYNIWCEGCGNPIGMGVRYNAEKSKIGMYYTTPLWKFRMKCHLCDQHFEIKTDPANCDYVIISGARRKEQRWDPTQNEQIVPEDKDDQKKFATDAMFKLEHGADDKGKAKRAQPVVTRLLERQDDRWKDDYMVNKLLRKVFRDKKKEIKATHEKDQKLLVKSSLDIDLLPESEEDARVAGLVKYGDFIPPDKKQQETRRAIVERPLFSTGPSMATHVIEPSSSTAKPLTNWESKMMHAQAADKLKTALANTRSLSREDLGIVPKKSLNNMEPSGEGALRELMPDLEAASGEGSANGDASYQEAASAPTGVLSCSLVSNDYNDSDASSDSNNLDSERNLQSTID